MKRELPLGLSLIVLGAIGIALSWGMTSMTFNNDPGPRLFPIFACTLLILCGAMMIVTGGHETPPATQRRGDGGSVLRGAIMSGLLVLYAIGLWLVGFTASTLAMCFALYWVIAGPSRRVIWRGAVYAALVTGAIYLLFARVLHAFLPHGILF